LLLSRHESESAMTSEEIAAIQDRVLARRVAKKINDELNVQLQAGQTVSLTIGPQVIGPTADEDLSALLSEVGFLREREKYFARVLQVADGGQYRADWDAAIADVLKERDAARAEVERLRVAVYGPRDMTRDETPEQMIRRLRLERDHYNQQHTELMSSGYRTPEEYDQACAERDAKVARLNAEIERLQSDNAQVRGWYEEEIRLGRVMADDAARYGRERDVAREQVERLRKDAVDLEEYEKTILAVEEERNDARIALAKAIATIRDVASWELVRAARAPTKIRQRLEAAITDPTGQAAVAEWQAMRFALANATEALTRIKNGAGSNTVCLNRGIELQDHEFDGIYRLASEALAVLEKS
jgi:hypothetical protein